MVPDSRVQALLERWRQGQDQGRPVSVEELCRDCPELRAEVERLIAGRHTLPPVHAEKTLLTPAQAPRSEATTTPPGLQHTGDFTPETSGVLPAAPATVTVLPLSQEPLPQVPGYEILGELGKGGMGVVYKARQLHLDRVVALKMIRAGAGAGAEERQRFLAEARAAAAIEHSGIVRVFDLGTHQGLPFFASEYCPNGSLARLLHGRPLPPVRAAEVVERIASAIEAAHQRGIIHRDLKPNNILLDGEEQPRVADFGLAKNLGGGGELTRSGVIMGTPAYMAPEQARGQKDVGPAADVWALGAILYECLTGRPPFKAATDYDTLMQVVAEEPAPVRKLQPEVPRDLEAVCLKCLEKDPRQRYTSARELAEELRRFRGGEQVRVRPVSVRTKAVRFARRHAWAVAGAACLAAALLVGVLLGSGVLGRRGGDPGAGAAVAAANAKDPEPDKQPQPPVSEMRVKLARLAREIARLLEEEMQTEVAVADFTGPQGPTGAGARIRQTLIEELKKLDVGVHERAFLTLGGECVVLEEKKGETRARLALSVRTKKGKKVLEMAADVVDRET
jgi:hypothetical protein